MKRGIKRLRILFRFRRQRRFGRRRALLVIVSMLIVGLQAIDYTARGQVESQYRITASVGALPFLDNYRRLYFNYFHFGLYPLALPDGVALDDDSARAASLLRDHAAASTMEIGYTYRSGDVGKILLFLVHSLMGAKSSEASFVPANALGFTAALLGLFGSFWLCGYGVLGAVTTLLLASNPFQIFEVYGQENVFCWTITCAIALAAIHLPLILSRRRLSVSRACVMAVMGALVLVSIRQIRSESFALCGTCALVWLIRPWAPWGKRVATTAVFAISLIAFSVAWQSYFERLFERTRAFVVATGGSPYDGLRYPSHRFWHAAFCGLGDFDTKYGYEWNDFVAYRYALPILSEKSHDAFPFAGDDYVLGDYYDSQKRYPRKPEDYPEYLNIVRAKILADISRDPKWYLGILYHRGLRIISHVTPLRLGAGRYFVSVPFLGWLAMGLALALLVARAYGPLLLLLFTSPLAFTALFVFSDRGTTFYSIHHVFAFALLFCAALEYCLGEKSRWLIFLRTVYARSAARPSIVSDTI